MFISFVLIQKKQNFPSLQLAGKPLAGKGKGEPLILPSRINSFTPISLGKLLSNISLTHF